MLKQNFSFRASHIIVIWMLHGVLTSARALRLDSFRITVHRNANSKGTGRKKKLGLHSPSSNAIERFSFDLEMVSRKQNTNNKRIKIL